ncbi:MAG: response regulator transcription factor [Patescibacteria group bacterium]|jgi:DNA-binding response OmpR family regulator
MKILLIEDDADIVRSLLPALKEAGYIATAIPDGEAGYAAAQTSEYDLIILDYNLPGLNGREIIEKIRAAGSSIPIIMLTVHSELGEKVDLLSIGADDYLTKPFSFSELSARIKAILRRPKNWEKGILKISDLELDSDRFLVVRGGQRISLPPKEFALLEYLLRHKGLIMSRQNIMEHVWDDNADPFSNTIEVHIRNLRRKLETDGRRLIFTVSNRGYKIDEEI